MYAQATYLNQRSGIATNNMEEPTFFSRMKNGQGLRIPLSSPDYLVRVRGLGLLNADK